MTGIAAVNADRMRNAVALGLRLAVLHAEVLGGRAEAWDPRFAMVRPHPGQVVAHELLGRIAAGSARLVPALHPPPVLDESGLVDGLLPEGELPQDPYTIRCVPQLMGAVLDVLDFHDRTVGVELASVTDNPIVLPEDDAILHGGNFYGQHVSFASDALSTAIVKLAVWTERAVARVTDRTQNQGLPSFLHGGPDGLNSGFMGAQVTASALVAEMRASCVPASIQSVPTNGNNQDVVTMGTIAARKAAAQLALLGRLQAIQALALAQAAELRSGPSMVGFAPESRALVAWVRDSRPRSSGSRPHSTRRGGRRRWPPCRGAPTGRRARAGPPVGRCSAPPDVAAPCAAACVTAAADTTRPRRSGDRRGLVVFGARQAAIASWRSTASMRTAEPPRRPTCQSASRSSGARRSAAMSTASAR